MRNGRWTFAQSRSRCKAVTGHGVRFLLPVGGVRLTTKLESGALSLEALLGSRRLPPGRLTYLAAAFNSNVAAVAVAAAVVVAEASRAAAVVGIAVAAVAAAASLLMPS